MRLSYSRINTYATCPRKDWLHYHERWRPKFDSATLRFGRAVDTALSEHFGQGADPKAVFLREWEAAKGEDLIYGARETWESLQATGTALIELFMDQHRNRVLKVHAVQQRFEYPVNDSLLLVGYIDLIADVVNDQGEVLPTIVDWKTSSRSYDPVQVTLDDQLTMYRLGGRIFRPEPEQVAFCTLVKTKEPKIEWHFAQRDQEAVEDLIRKARWTSDQILSGVNHKNPGAHCAWCDFAPICTGDDAAIAETLIQLSEVTV